MGKKPFAGAVGKNMSNPDLGPRFSSFNLEVCSMEPGLQKIAPNSAMAQVLFVQAVHDHRAEMGFSLSEEEISAYDRYFESLPTTMVTLFMSISNGVSWENAMFPLMKISPLWMLCFLFFVSRPPRDAKCLLLVFMFLSLSIMCRYRITVMVWDTGASKLCIVN